MRKTLLLFAITTLIFACSSKDPKMCECLEAGEKLNAFSAAIMLRDINENDAQKMNDLKAKKATACKDYLEMSGEEMLKRKASCDK